MRNLIRAGVIVVVPIVILWVWYSVAANYSYSAVSGTYCLTLPRETSTLVLQQNQTFQQERILDGKSELTEGSWRRIGQSGVVFSKEFLKLSGQELRADGQADGEVKKHLGLFLSIRLNPDSGGPILQKSFFN